MANIVEIYRGANVAENVSRIYRGSTLQFERQSNDPAVQALLDQAVIDGFTAASGDALDALNDFVIELKAQGIWTLLDVLWLPATNGDSDFACYNLKDPTQFNLTKVNSPAFTSLEGFTGDGVSAYLDTNFSPSNNSIVASQNSQSFGIYTRSQTTSGNQGGGNIRINRSSSSFVAYRIGDTTNTSDSMTDAIEGLVVTNRPDSSTKEVYKNGVLEDSVSVNSVSHESLELAILALRNGVSSLTQYQDSQVSFTFYGADVSSKSSEFYTAIQTYMTAIGKEV